jgi:DNA mismatch repair ATPase MutS
MRPHGSLSPRRHNPTIQRRGCLPLQVHLQSQNRPDLRLRPGRSLSSYGTNCALFSGIPRELIARAERYTELQASGDDLVTLIRGETNQQELQELKVAEETAKRFVAWEIDPIDVRPNLNTILGSEN